MTKRIRRSSCESVKCCGQQRKIGLTLHLQAVFNHETRAEPPDGRVVVAVVIVTASLSLLEACCLSLMLPRWQCMAVHVAVLAAKLSAHSFGVFASLPCVR